MHNFYRFPPRLWGFENPTDIITFLYDSYWRSGGKIFVSLLDKLIVCAFYWTSRIFYIDRERIHFTAPDIARGPIRCGVGGMRGLVLIKSCHSASALHIFRLFFPFSLMTMGGLKKNKARSDLALWLVHDIL
jgi:hypothetical protein